MSMRKNQEDLFKKINKSLTKEERVIFEAYKGSLSTIKDLLFKIDDKDNWTLNDLLKYDRLNKLQSQIIVEVRSLTKTTYDIIKKANADVVKLAYYTKQFGFEKELDSFLNFALLNADLVKQIVENPLPNVTLADLLKDLTAKQIKDLKVSLGQGLSLGEGINKVAKRLKDNLNIAYNRAVLIANTEMGRASSKAQLLAINEAEKLGIKMTKVWLATLDTRTRISHRHMDMKKADKDGLWNVNGVVMDYPRSVIGLKGGNSASETINCRCSAYEELDDYPSELTKRMDNESKELINEINYDEWLVLKKKRGEL